MAMFWEISVVAVGPSFEDEEETYDTPPLATSGVQDVINELASCMPSTPAKKMKAMEPLDNESIQDPVVLTFDGCLEEQREHTVGVVLGLQTDHKLTAAAIGTMPKGYTLGWSTLDGVCPGPSQS